ncbi:MAG: VOC family protein [Bacteroidota bacterium]
MSTNSPVREPLQGTVFAVSITVKDLQKSLAWYTDVVGFTIERKIERNGVVTGISMRAGEVRISINQDDGAKGWERVKAEGFSLRITTDQNIDEIAQQIKAAGGILDSEPADMPWGVRMIRLRDLDGFKFSISRPLPAKP